MVQQTRNTDRTLTVKTMGKYALVEKFCDDLDNYFTILLKSEIMPDAQGELHHQFVTILAEDERLQSESD